MISVRGLRKRFDDHELFRGIDLDVKDSEVVVIIGPSGSGKSTFFRCINGLDAFQEGEIRVGSAVLSASGFSRRDLHDEDVIREVRKMVGMVFQQFNLFPHMTVLENIIEAPLNVRGKRREEAAEEARQLLDRIGMLHKADRYPAYLSGGEQQRVAIVRALAMSPEAMLFDEPTSSLDPEMTGEVLAVIRDLVAGGMTTLIATHEMDFAREVAHRVVVFDHGEVIESGPPETIFTNPSTQRARDFLGRCLRGRGF